MHKTNTMHCKNCETNTLDTSIYCSTCGEKIIHERITIKKMIHELAEDGFGWDNRLLHTFRTTLLNPKKIADEFLAGKQKRYLKPFSYMAIALTISIFFYSIYEKEIATKMLEMYESMLSSNPFLTEEKINNLLKFTTKYQNIIAFTYIPLYAILSSIFYRKRYNFAEHIVLNAYIYSTSSLLSTLFMFLYIKISMHPLVIQLLLIGQIVLFTYFFIRIWQNKFWKTILRGFLYFLGMLFLTYVVIGGISNLLMYLLF